MRRTLTTAGLLTAAYALWVRPKMLNAGATPKEIKGPFPGADIVPGGKRTPTMGITLDAPPSRVWPWLVQMGCDRAGWYSWDRLDNAGRPSATRLHPEWQSLQVGQRLAADPSGAHWFEVAALEPERFLGLRATLTPLGRPYPASGPRPPRFIDSLWAFQLKPLPQERTRLLVSGYSAQRPWLLTTLNGLLFWEPAHWLMQTRQFKNLQRRAESSASPRGLGLAQWMAPHPSGFQPQDRPT